MLQSELKLLRSLHQGKKEKCKAQHGRCLRANPVPIKCQQSPDLLIKCFASGRERCYRVSWDMQGLPPTDADTSELPDVTQQDIPQDALMRKDANEVLVKDGPEALRQCIDLAEPLPIRGLFRLACLTIR